MNLTEMFERMGVDTEKMKRDQPAPEPVAMPKRCREHIQEEPCADCAEDKARGYAVRVLAGRCANGSELGHGTRWHAVPIDERGMRWAALCGAQPGRRSAGWSSWFVRGQAVTCPRCLKKMEAKR